MRRTTAILVAVLATVVGLGIVAAIAVRGASPSDGGPLSTAGAGGVTWCVPDFSPGGDLGHGSEVLENKSSAPLNVTDVELINNRGFELVEAFGRDMKGMTAGVLPEWPPRRARSLYALDLVPADSRFNLVLHLRSEPSDISEASLSGVRIEYEQDGRPYFATTNFVVKWKKVCGRPR